MTNLRSIFLSTSCLTAVALLCALTLPVNANPVDGNVSAGSATISQNGNTLNVLQQSEKAVIDWRGFDIARGETTQFIQPSAAAIALNRVNSNAPSFINGNLTANGNIIIVNPNGVWFGSNSRVDVNGLIASTADIGNDAFMNGQGKFNFDKAGNPDAAIVNDGVITAKEAGLVGLVAPSVINRGVIFAKLGRVQLASGDTATVDLYGDGLMNVAVSDKVKSQLVSNSGVIAAQGGVIALTAAAGKDVVNSLVTVTGELHAPSISQKNGKIIIAAEGSNRTSKQGNSKVAISGVLNASGRGVGERGGDITVTGDNIALLAGTRMNASGSDGLSNATFGKAVSAMRVGAAGGDIKIGGDYLGGGDTQRAKNLYVDKDVLVLNDAINSGDAGRSIFWSDGTTQFYGNVYARALGGKGVDATTWHANAGGNAGNGGFVETSGHDRLDAGGYVDLTSSNGERGTYFLDPTDITIYGNVTPRFVSTDGSINLDGSLQLWIDGSNASTVTLSYNSVTTTSSSSSGNVITVSSAANLKVGQRIQIGGSSGTQLASVNGTAGIYTITAIAGNNVTLDSSAGSVGNGTTIFGGYVRQVNDLSSNGNNATQSNAAIMPLWLSNGENGLGTINFTADTNALLFNDLSNIRSAFFNVNQLGKPAYVAIIGQTIAGPDWHGSNNSTDLFDVTYTSPSVLNGTATVNGASVTPISVTVTSAFENLGFVTAANTGANTIGNDRLVYNRGWIGNYGEVILYSAALSTDAQALINQYQSLKWGIALTPPGTGGNEVAKATASNGYSAFSTRYLEYLSQSANISLQATNNINLDLKGDTLNFATASRSLTLTANNTINTLSAGTVTTNGGNITLNGTNGINLNDAFTFNSNGGNIAFNNAVMLGGNVSVNSGTGTTTFASTINNLRAISNVQALVVAGGGGGGGGTGGGGGGGGVVSNASYAVTAGNSVGVTVGAGGAAGSGVGFAGTSGTNSVFGSLTAIGGGGGGANNNVNGLPGGSGGGGAWNSTGAAGTASQGNNGASGASAGPPNYGSGGGGGAGTAGSVGTTTAGGKGGDGVVSSITGANTTYAGGGGGGSYSGGTLGAGGSGGGGAATVSGTANTGGGGGGATNNSGNGGAGGSGVVVVRYSGTAAQATVTGGTATTVDGDTVWTFTGTGTFVAKNIGCVSGCNLTINAATANLNGPIGGARALGAVSITTTNALALPSISATSIAATSNTSSIGGAGGLVTNGGNINLTANTDIDLSAIGIITNNGNATLNGRDILLNTGINTGTGDFTANASRDIFITKNVLNTGLVNYYKLDEATGTTATDSAGSNTGTFVNSPTYVTSTPYGVSGSSVTFNGSTNYIGLLSSPISGNGAFTLSAWINTSTVSKYSGAIAIGTSGGAQSAYIGTVQGAQIGGNNSIGGGFYGYNIGSGNTTLNQWNYVTMTYSGGSNGTVNMYVNGVLTNTTTYTPSLNNTMASIGRIGTNSIYNMQGMVDDVRIYNTALTQTQVSQLYAPQVAWQTGTTALHATRDVSFDLTTDTLTTSAGKNIDITGRNISAASAGTIATSQNAGSGGNINIAATGTLNTTNLTQNIGGAATLSSTGAATLGTITAKTISAQTTGTTSDITIASGKVLTASATGDAITLASARNFINNSGAGALVTSAGRWLVHSTTPGSDTIGSLANTFRRFSCTFGGSCPSIPTSGNGLLYTATPSITATPATISSIAYGSSIPTLNGYAYTLSGYLASDAAADNVTGTLVGSTSYTAGSSVASYNINYASGMLTSAMGYAISYANNASAFSVTQRAITVTADAGTKVYGAADPALTYQITTGSLFNTDTLSGALSRAPGNNFGTYAIGQNTLSASSNYALTFVGANFNVTKAPLTVTANALGKTYGGVDPTLTYSNSGLVNGDTTSVFTGALSRATGGDFGTYAIGQNTLSAGSNYTITYNGANFSIARAPLTITAIAASKTYGTADPFFTFIGSGLVNGDTSAIYNGAMDRVYGENVGAYAIVLATLFADNNYTITFNSANMTITPATLDITAHAAGKVSGTVDPALTYSYSGFVMGDTDSILTGALSRAAGESAGIYAINRNTVNAGANYVVNYTGANFTITAAPQPPAPPAPPAPPVIPQPAPVAVNPSDIPVTVIRVSQDPTLNLAQHNDFTPLSTPAPQPQTQTVQSSHTPLNSPVVIDFGNGSNAWLKISPELAAYLDMSSYPHH